MMLATTFSNLSGMLFCNSSKKPGRTSQAIVTAGTARIETPIGK